LRAAGEVLGAVSGLSGFSEAAGSGFSKADADAPP